MDGLSGFLGGSMLALAAFGVFLFVCLAIAGVVLRFAVGLYNHFVGGKESTRAIARPSLAKAMVIVLVVGVIGTLVESIMRSVLDAGAAGAQAVSFVIGFVVMSALLSWMLPTSFVRGLAVTADWYLAVFIIVAIVLLVALLVGLLMAV